MPLVIGIDGGGTKTEAVLCRVEPDGELRRLGRCVTGPSNLQLASFAGLTGEVRAAIDGVLHAVAEVADPPSPLAAVCFCMAGAGNGALRQRFEEWAESERIARRITVTHDARCLIAAGTRGDAGVALIAGTGSFAYARRADGTEDRCGGWGNLFGDEGSGYWLALQALQAASWAVDGRGPATELVPAVAEWLQCERPEQWLAKLRTLTSDQIASASKLVTQLAEAGDGVADGLLDRCVDELARMLVTLAGRAFPGQPVDVALAGGMIVHNQSLREAVLERTRHAGVRIDHCQPVPNPVDGAVRLASQML